MKKWIKIIMALAVTGLIAAFLVYKFYINKPHKDIEHAKAEYTLNAQDLWNAYNTDLAKADSLYTGKVLLVEGNLSRVEKSDSLSYAVIVMEADSLFGDKSIRFEMLPNFTDKVANLQPGVNVKIKGACNGFDQTDIKLGSCSIPE